LPGDQHKGLSFCILWARGHTMPSGCTSSSCRSSR
jgi:hypothetical protein